MADLKIKDKNASTVSWVNIFGDSEKVEYDENNKLPIANGGIGNLSNTEFAALAHPVNSIYISYSTNSPAAMFGGTWEQLKDVMLLADGDKYHTGDTGGESSVTLTRSQLPSHSHSHNMNWAYFGWDGAMKPGSLTFDSVAGGFSGHGSGTWGNMAETRDGHQIAYWIGGGNSHNNLPQCKKVFVWKRIS